MNGFGRWLRRARDAAGLTQEEAAAKVPVKAKAWANWERGRNLPDWWRVEAIASAVSAPVDEAKEQWSQEYERRSSERATAGELTGAAAA